jgi:hypothetical protein
MKKPDPEMIDKENPEWTTKQCHPKRFCCLPMA